MTDLDIIAQIERQIGKRIHRDSSNHNCYKINSINQVDTLYLTALAEFPTAICELANLTHLNIMGQSRPQEFEESSETVKLTSFFGKLLSPSTQIEQPTRLKRLKYLSSNIGRLHNLRCLELWDNDILSLPTEIGDLKNLETLLISGNLNLYNLPYELGGLQNLQTLDLRICGVVNLPNTIGRLKNLKKLSVYGGQLTTLPIEIGQLQQLEYLEVGDNPLERVPNEIGNLKNLKRLNISYNRHGLFELPESRLTSLPKEVGNLPDSCSISAYGTALISPPLEIVNKGIPAIRSYFAALEEKQQEKQDFFRMMPSSRLESIFSSILTKEPPRKKVISSGILNELKLLIVGDGSAGKTSLMKRLIGQPFDRNESQTHGINLNTFAMTVPALNNAEIKLHCWDFGGQEIMHATHQFFLTKRSLYLVVLNARRETKIDYWLKQIQQVSDNAPIIIVINKIDENSHFDLPRAQLKQNYPNIQHFCRLSCATDAGLTDLMTAIQQTIPKVELVQTLFPASWWQVKTAIVEQAQTKNFISYDHFTELCQANEIYEESAQHTLISLLHELGIVTHFDQPWLRETNVINPRWLTEAVYKLVTAKQAENGKLPLTALAQLLDSKVYPSHKHDYLIGLIERFELCYRFDQDTLLFPELLSHSEPDLTELHQQIQAAETLHFVLNYTEFLPKSIFTRFLVRSQRYIDKSYLWKNGVVLHEPRTQTTALIQLSEPQRKITLQLLGTHKQDFLAVLLFLLRDIHNSFKRLEVDERLALPDNPAITVSYQNLLELLQDGETEIRPEGTKKKYNIHQLLGTVYRSQPTEAEIMAFLRTLIESQTIPDEKTFWQKFKDSIELKIPFVLGSIDVRKLVSAVFKK